MKILLIEDNADLRVLLKEALEAAGYEVRAAAEGRAGIEASGKFQPDAVVSDIFMPGMEGFETIAQFRKRFPDVRIIAISGGAAGQLGRPHADHLKIASYVGADAALRKPFDPEQLIGVVRQLVG